MGVQTRVGDNVALHPEGVDRNGFAAASRFSPVVALHPEGVDRNYPTPPPIKGDATSPSTRRAWIEIVCDRREFRPLGWSPSTRRAWIEIKYGIDFKVRRDVALHPEGVDRNAPWSGPDHPQCTGRPPPGGRG